MEDEQSAVSASESAKQDVNDPEQEPAEMSALRLELATLSTSYSSLQSTVQLLQTQLIDLKRVNNELQEENESYNILLREKTLNGQFDVLRMGGNSVSEASSDTGAEDDGEMDHRDTDSFRSRGTGRGTPLDRVDELPEEHSELDPEFGVEPRDTESHAPSPRKHSRKRGSSMSSRSPTRRGESLANLPITGPGLDLAAELGRAENKDILGGSLDSENVPPNVKSRSGKKDAGRKVSSDGVAGAEGGQSLSDLDQLRSEVKSLKDANRALSLYASKIIDRIISQEGFEHVLAVDYEKGTTPSPVTAGPRATTFEDISNANSPKVQEPSTVKKSRPQSTMFAFSSVSASPTSTQAAFTPPPEKLTTFSSPVPSTTASPPSSSPPAASTSTRASRRSLSFDWKSFSIFKEEKKPDPMANLRPLTLRAGASSVVSGARKLDTHEDDEDRRERERLNATMKLMGIEKPASPVMPSLQHKSFSSPANANAGSAAAGDPSSGALRSPLSPSTAVPPTPQSQTRFSFFRRNSTATPNTSESSSVQSSQQNSPLLPGSTIPGLTQEALVHAEAESSLAALDAHERQLSAEIAKGAGGGFTEVARRNSERRSSKRSGGSGSTVWSAGMSRVGDSD